MSMEKILTDANFETETAGGIVLVDFWAPWCGPCRMQGPILERIAEQYAGKAAVAKMNVDENPQIPQQLDIVNIPTLIIFKDGQAEKRFVGVQPQEILAVELDAFLSTE